jgi:hypothetical protein
LRNLAGRLAGQERDKLIVRRELIDEASREITLSSGRANES